MCEFHAHYTWVLRARPLADYGSNPKISLANACNLTVLGFTLRPDDGNPIEVPRGDRTRRFALGVGVLVQLHRGLRGALGPAAARRPLQLHTRRSPDR